MHTVETDWWSLDLPEEWGAEQDEETIVIGDEDGVGVIEITVLEHGEGGDADLATLARQLFPQYSAPAHVQLGEFAGLYFQYSDEGDAVREWLLRKSGQILLVSYSCDVENAGLDDEIVDEILDTLRAK
jgi:hypothetical protein